MLTFDIIRIATDQMHLMSLDSLLRNFLERLPLPQHATLRTIKAYEGARKWFNKVEAHLLAKAQAAEARAAESLGETLQGISLHDAVVSEPQGQTEVFDRNVKRPEFPDPLTLPRELRQEEARERIRCYMMLAYAAFGDEDPYIQTAADSAMSTNAPLRLHSFGRWGEDLACSRCHIRMPTMFFPNACLCDKDRLHDFCLSEADHLKKTKRRIIEKLGCGRNDEPAKILEDTNIDFTSLQDSRGASLLQLPSDFDDALDSPDSALHQFYNEARALDARDPRGQSGRFQRRQTVHPYAGLSLANATVQDQLGIQNYRRGYTVEDFAKNRRGFNARNTARESQF